MGIQNVNAGAAVVADGHGNLSTGAIPLTAPLVLPSVCDKTLMYGHLLIQAPDIRVYNRDSEGVWDGIHWDGEHGVVLRLARNRRKTSSGETVSSQQMRVPWNFSDSRRTNLSLDDFLAAKEAAGVTFFNGKEPWMQGVNKLTWQIFFRVCTREMDDLSQRATKLVIEYCLEILEEVEGKLGGKASRARLETALNLQWAEQYENKVFQYRWALRHPVVNEAVTRGLRNRFPDRS